MYVKVQIWAQIVNARTYAFSITNMKRGYQRNDKQSAQRTLIIFRYTELERFLCAFLYLENCFCCWSYHYMTGCYIEIKYLYIRIKQMTTRCVCSESISDVSWCIYGGYRAQLRLCSVFLFIVLCGTLRVINRYTFIYQLRLV